MTGKIHVSTLGELYTALSKAKAGETILLAEGDYGKLTLNNTTKFPLNFPPGVTIASADPDRPAVFSEMTLHGVKNLTLDGLMFDYTFSPGQPVTYRPFQVNNSENVTIRNSVFDGDVAKGMSADADGYGTGFGLAVRWSKSITVENNEVREFVRGIVASQTEDLVIRGNELHSLRADGMLLSQLQRVLIEGNYIHDFRASYGSTDHRDMIQLFTNGTKTPSSDITIRNNHFDIGEGSPTQTIFMRNEEVDLGRAGAEMFYRNITIEGNVIVNGHLNGIMVGHADGVVVRSNSVLHADGENKDGLDAAVEIPRITVVSSSKNVTIESNATSGIVGWSGQAGWTVKNNAFVQDQNPQAPGWYGDVFLASSLVPQDGKHLFVAKPGGMLDLLDAGAPATLAPPAGSEVALQFHVETVPGDAATRVFDATLMLEKAGGLPAGTVFHWDFGDGTAAKGTVVAHTYTGGGAFPVTLTAILPSGAVAQTGVVLGVNGPEVLALGPKGFIAWENGAVAAEIAAANLGPNGLVLGGKGTTASVHRQHVVDLVQADSFTIAFTLDAATKSSSGELFRLHGSFVSGVNAKGELTFTVMPEGGGKQQVIVASGVKVNDTKAHAIEISLADGKLTIEVDGKLAASADLVAPIGSLGNNNLIFGNPWGASNFSGTLSDLVIIANAEDFPAVAETTILAGAVPDPVAILPPEIAPDLPDYMPAPGQEDPVDPPALPPGRVPDPVPVSSRFAPPPVPDDPDVQFNVLPLF